MSSSPTILTLRNDLSELGRLAEFVDTFCAPLRPTEKDLMAIQLSVEEAVTNVIAHGYKDGQAHVFTVELQVSPENRITVVVRDDAPAFDPLALPEVDVNTPIEEREIGGLGVHLVKKLMDRAQYERRDGQNVLTLERRLGTS